MYLSQFLPNRWVHYRLLLREAKEQLDFHILLELGALLKLVVPDQCKDFESSGNNDFLVESEIMETAAPVPNSIVKDLPLIWTNMLIGLVPGDENLFRE